MKKLKWLATLSAMLLGVLLSASAVRADDPPAPQARLILGDDSIWRCDFVNRKPVVKVGQELHELAHDSYSNVWRFVEEGKGLRATMDTPAPPADWIQPDFDDLAWTRLKGPFFPTQHAWAWTRQTDDMGFLGYEGTTPSLSAICVRGRFMVTDPAKAGDMRLSLVFRGGVAVYLNGREVVRANLPDANKADGVLALAEGYPDEAFVKPDGGVIGNYTDTMTFYDRLKTRLRRVDEVVIPAALLRKGMNVLAIEGHRTYYNECIFGKGRSAKGYVINWATVGVVHIGLTATGPGIEPNAGRPAGLQAWNQETWTRATPEDYGNPCDPLRPIPLVGARNGAFSGQVVVGSRDAIRNLKAVAGELKGPGVIPASAVQIRFGLNDPDQGPDYDMLSPDAPAEIAPAKGGGAVVPVWVTVRVPADAKAGDYRGVVTVSADGSPAIAVPVALSVAGWTLPDPAKFVSHVGLTESPESVALRYKVPLWSDAHWKLLDQVFALTAQAGADDLFITALSKTHYGNEYSMIRRVKRPDGTLGVDLSIAEKYLDLAIKHLGKIPVVCIYCWEPYTGSTYGGHARASSGAPTYTLLDPATGALTEADGPAWGSDQARAFWQPVFDAVREMLAKRDMSGSLMIGVAGDNRPNKDAVEDLKAVAPKAGWVIQSHMTGSELYGQPVTYLADVWNSPGPPDPALKHAYGWQDSFLRVSFPRAGSYTLIRSNSPLAQYRLAMEMTSTAGIHGIGRVGVDFWNVLKTRNNTYGKGLSLIAHYPKSDWGQLYLGNSTPYVLAPGPTGPLATARFEEIRQGAQDLEARVFLEKALLDPTLRAKLGDDLADRCRKMLDDRIRAMILGHSSWLLYSGAQQNLEALYSLTSEAAAKLGG
ncbi:MAG: hypothetical protein BIFFINMI_01355 [Phycisphaerae bacterium]|nr:hypothetical protein [Phycisphaerae bacterium]